MNVLLLISYVVDGSDPFRRSVETACNILDVEYDRKIAVFVANKVADKLVVDVDSLETNIADVSSEDILDAVEEFKEEEVVKPALELRIAELEVLLDTQLEATQNQLNTIQQTISALSENTIEPEVTYNPSKPGIGGMVN